MMFNKIALLALCMFAVCYANDMTQYRFLAQNTNLQNTLKCVTQDQTCANDMVNFMKKFNVNPMSIDPTTISTEFPCISGCIEKNDALKKLLQAMIEQMKNRPTDAELQKCADEMKSLSTDIQALTKTFNPSDIQKLISDDEISPKIYELLQKHSNEICAPIKSLYEKTTEFFNTNSNNATFMSFSVAILSIFAFVL